MDNAQIIVALKTKVTEDRNLRGQQVPDPKQAAFEAAVEAAIVLLTPAPAEEEQPEA